MTAPLAAVTLTPEVHAYFAEYHRRHPSWGIYHVWLDDGNWAMAAPEQPSDCGGAYPLTDDDRAMWSLFRLMTPSQRRRIMRKIDEQTRG